MMKKITKYIGFRVNLFTLLILVGVIGCDEAQDPFADYQQGPREGASDNH
jgi:hypothetical protein